MSKLSQQEEKELIYFIKDWLKSHGFNQKDLANELNIKSSRTSEISLKIKEFYKRVNYLRKSIVIESLKSSLRAIIRNHKTAILLLAD